ncbi:MAG TPA: hypothetical protein VFB46_00930 [Gemmatimonadaceae bacterium]|nr:hypothetical protein [Gemmatimonadaceae bacterium]
MRFIRFVAVATLMGFTAGCEDTLGVRNNNNPDRDRTLATALDVQSVGASQFQQIISGTLGGTARTQTGMLTAAFENASGLANNGLGPRSGIPRQPIDNGRGNAYQTDNFNDFRILTIAARTSADVLVRAKAEGFTLGTTEGDVNRLIAFAHFVNGVAMGFVSLVYDSAGVPRESDSPVEIVPLVGYPDVNEAALEALDSALAYATKPGTSDLPTNWLTGPGGPTVTNANFVRIIRSFKARIRAGVARNPTERAAVDWDEVIADATNGITADLQVRMDPTNGWDYTWLAATLHFRDANWHQMTYYIIGMADVSGGFDAWLATSRDARSPFLIVTPDLRFPQGSTRAAQQAVGQGAPSGRRYFRNRSEGDQAALGWANSWYDHYRWYAWSQANRVGLFPIFTRAENDMLAAEGYLRTGNVAAAAALIDRTRTTAGLPALTGAVTAATDPVPGGASCVPRVPVGPNFTSTQCGSVFEAMKWEKRMETAYTTYGAWFFDSRGWGDLPEGTPVHWPVPNQELDARLLPIYNLGGVGLPGGAGAGTYGYGSGATR